MMKTMRSCTMPGIAILAVVCFAGPASAVRVPRIELLREVRVAGANVFLSDLLPASAGVSLRARADEISLGAAPQPGNTRVLERDGVLGSIGTSENVTAEIAVPERIVVSREARPITVQEVFTAIENTLRQSGISSAGNLRPEDIVLQSEILVGPGDAGLEVLRSDFDAALKRARFLLWPSHDPKVLPFFVAVRFAGYSPLANLLAGKVRSRTASEPEEASVRAAPVKAEILVSPGDEATLLIHTGGLRMMADVVPLERGTMGQHVHVRVVDTGKIFSALVDGRAHLDLQF